jgi:hypothetical protein
MNTSFANSPVTRRQLLTLLALVAMPFVAAGCGKKPTTSKPPLPPEATQESTTLEGSLDILTANKILGWAWDKTKPNEAIYVEIFDGGTLLGTVKADLMRQDIAAKGRGTGKYGFEFPTPPRLKDGKPHQIHARVKGTEFELHGSPAQVKF